MQTSLSDFATLAYPFLHSSSTSIPSPLSAAVAIVTCEPSCRRDLLRPTLSSQVPFLLAVLKSTITQEPDTISVAGCTEDFAGPLLESSSGLSVGGIHFSYEPRYEFVETKALILLQTQGFSVSAISCRVAIETAMPRYYCDYCDTYLTHDSPSVRKQHNAGYKHKANVRAYYQQFEEQQTQSLIDQRIKEHLGQAAVFQQVGSAFNQHLLTQRPRFPVLPTPGMPIAGNAQIPGSQPLMPGIRPPVLPRPFPGAPGYASIPPMPPMVPPPGAPGAPGQAAIPRPPTLAPPAAAPGSATTPTSNGAPSVVSSAMYQANPTAPSSGGYEGFNANSQSTEGNH